MWTTKWLLMIMAMTIICFIIAVFPVFYTEDIKVCVFIPLLLFLMFSFLHSHFLLSHNLLLQYFLSVLCLFHVRKLSAIKNR